MLPPIDLLPHSILSKHYRSRQFSSRFIRVQCDWTPVPRASLNLSLLRTSFRRRVSGGLLSAHVSSPKHSVAIHSRLRERSSFADASSRIWTKEFGLGAASGAPIAGRYEKPQR